MAGRQIRLCRLLARKDFLHHPYARQGTAPATLAGGHAPCRSGCALRIGQPVTRSRCNQSGHFCCENSNGTAAQQINERPKRRWSERIRQRIMETIDVVQRHRFIAERRGLALKMTARQTQSQHQNQHAQTSAAFGSDANLALILMITRKDQTTHTRPEALPPTCWQREAQAACLRLELPSGETHIISYAHFLAASLQPAKDTLETLSFPFRVTKSRLMVMA